MEGAGSIEGVDDRASTGVSAGTCTGRRYGPIAFAWDLGPVAQKQGYEILGEQREVASDVRQAIWSPRTHADCVTLRPTCAMRRG